MLNSVLPVAFVNLTIDPVHLAITVSEVVRVAADVVIATLPAEFAFTVLLVIQVVAFVLIALRVRLLLQPMTFSILLAFLEVSGVDGARLPLVLAITVRLSILVLTSICVLVCKVVCSLSIFERCSPLSFVLVTVGPLMNTIAPDFVISPLAHVTVVVETLPDSETVLAALNPFAVVDFSTGPCVNTFSVRLVVEVAAQVLRTILIDFKALPASLVILPLSLVEPSALIYLNTIPMPLTFLFTNLASINCSIFVLLYCKELTFLDFVIIEQV